MSHSPYCPDDYEARREARWDAHSGWNRHRYQDECPDAHEAYEREYRRESYRMKEAREEERLAEARAERRLREEAEWEEAQVYEHRADEYERAMEREYAAYVAAEYEAHCLDEARVNADADPPHTVETTEGQPGGTS